jgi:hypothetical protein
VQALTFFYSTRTPLYDTKQQQQLLTLFIMKYFTALSIVASMVAAQGDMQIMSLSPAPAGAVTHTVSASNSRTTNLN